MLLKILLFPDPRLRTVASKVENVNAEIKSLCDNMLETMYESGGIGLAATQVNIHKITRAVDCGLVVNPDQWDAQVQAGVVWGLAHTFSTGHTVRAGQLGEKNFDTYKLPRIGQMSEYEVHAVPTKNDPTGIGEPVFHTMAPAITNAIFAATGKRIRSLPLNKHGMSLA